jgi:hypothetical protein
MTELINKIRYYHFISGVLGRQQADPLCGKCKAFANTAASMKDGIAELESCGVGNMLSLSTELLALFEEARDTMELIEHPWDALGQKKAGNCGMPEGVCFIKLPKSILDKI